MRGFTYYFSQMHTIMTGWQGGPPADRISAATWHPPVDIYERDESFVVVVELPGVDTDRINVHAEQETLVIEGCRGKRLPDQTRCVQQMEIPHGPFTRLLRLPDNVDIARIHMAYADGYLTIEIPKVPAR
jgi:HSP20 family protein